MSRSSPSAGWKSIYDEMDVPAETHTGGGDDDLEPILEDDDVLDLECRCHEIDAPVPCWPCIRDGRKPLSAAPRGDDR
ncbi:hypothetical protein [Halopiger djelfimassiliensis]|uniref:hypothetical protein n=1 Tax=Halopiger djelfimassiliensis TaxID=1293047 RepID=UPI0006779B76|nr:hypothetical protein [Halopiger djelfimassiliensis]